MKQDMVKVEGLDLKSYKDRPLFMDSSEGIMLLYKRSGQTIDDARTAFHYLPQLFIRLDDVKREDRYCIDDERALMPILDSYRDLKNSLSQDIGMLVKSSSPNIESAFKSDVQSSYGIIIEGALEYPLPSMLDILSDTVSAIVSGYRKNPRVVGDMLMLNDGFSPEATHSANTFALMLGYCSSINLSDQLTKDYALAAMLHDIGKIGTPEEILSKPAMLDENEQRMVREHPKVGYGIIRRSGIDDFVAEAVYCHHERIDGSGYPQGISDLTPMSQALGIIDVYEALTNHSRPYRDPITQYEALDTISKDVDCGRYSRDIFSGLVNSLK